MKNVSKMIVVLFAVSILSAASPEAQAGQRRWAQQHPRRAEVNRRDKHLENKTERLEKNGKLTDSQAQGLESREQSIHQEQKADAAANGGHITKEQQQHLNQELRGVRKDMHNDVKENTAAVPPAPSN